MKALKCAGWRWTGVKCEIIHETLQRYCKLFLLQDTHILRAHAVIKLEVKLQRPPGKLKHH